MRTMGVAARNGFCNEPTNVDAAERVIKLMACGADETFRASLEKLLRAEPALKIVCGACESQRIAELVSEFQPDVLLLDCAAVNLPIVDCVRSLVRSCSNARIVVMGSSINSRRVIEMVRLGAHGFLPRDSSTALFRKCIRSVAAGQYWVARDSVSHLVALLRESGFRTPAHEPGLTERERQIVCKIAAGCKNREIASMFEISEQTVKHHLTSIFAKLGVNSRLALAVFALKHRLLEE
jgi:DNA-binding NarL/FixJ family response regulator